MTAKRAMPKSTMWETTLGVGCVETQTAKIARILSVEKEQVEKFSALLMPRTTNDLSEIIQNAVKNNISLYTPEHIKAGTLPGEVKPDAVILAPSSIEKRISIKANTLIVEISGGVTVDELKNALEKEGLELQQPLPPCPTDIIIEILSLSSGCNTNLFADGTGEITLAARGALATGELFGSLKAPRSAAGPDLDWMFWGTGNTLGIITGAALRIKKKPTDFSSLSFEFDDTKNALEAVSEFFQRGGVCENAGITYTGKSARVFMELTGWEQGVVKSYESFMKEIAEKNHGLSLEKPADTVTSSALSKGLWSTGVWGNLFPAAHGFKANQSNSQNKGAAAKSALHIPGSALVINSPAIEGARFGVVPDSQRKNSFNEDEKKTFVEYTKKHGLTCMPGHAATAMGKDAFKIVFGDFEPVFKELKKKLDIENILNPYILSYPSV